MWSPFVAKRLRPPERRGVLRHLLPLGAQGTPPIVGSRCTQDA